MKKNLLMLFLVSCCFITQVMAQSIVKGKVTNEKDGIAVPGVTIRVKGTAIVGVTAADGTYSIRASVGQVLAFSFIGYVTKDVTIGSALVYDVKMTESEGTLNEVVVTAYNVSREKKSLGYSAQTVKGDEVSQTEREDFFGGLQGRVAGLSINSTNGNPGASAQIVLRGFTSVSGDNNALIVIDGVPINNTTLNQTFQLVSGAPNRDQDYSNRGMDINPNDIETYTIMKGAEATALYGSAGAGGAILITTKKGKAGTSIVNYSSSYRVEKMQRFPQIQTKYNSGGTGGIFDGTVTTFFGPAFLPTTPIYDNIRRFYQDGTSMKQTVSFEGGSDKLTYRWSNDYVDTKGTIPTTTYTRFSSRLTGSAVISPLLKVTTSFNYVNSVNNKTYKGQNSTIVSLMRFSSAFDLLDYQNIDGTRKTHTNSIYSEYDNPLWDVNKDPAQDKTDRLLANVNFQFTPSKWLSVNAIVGTDVANTTGYQVYNGQSYRGSGSAGTPTLGSITQFQELDRLYNGSLVATAKRKLKDFTGTLIGGLTFEDFNATTNSQSGSHFYDPNFYSLNNTLPTTRLSYVDVNRYRTVGAFAQALFGYKSLLYLTLTGRVDGTSKLMPSLNAATGGKVDRSPYFAYPSVSLAFNFTELKQVKDAVPFLDYGKLRGSYALTGKGPFRRYALGTNYAGATSTGGGYALSVNGGNPDLVPETGRTFETGVELQFFNNRIGIDFNYFNTLSSDQIIFPRLSYGSGFVLKLLNGGQVKGSGFEVILTGAPVRNKDFKWDITANFAKSRSIVLSLAEELPELYDSDTAIIGALRSAASPGSSIGNVTGQKLDRNNAGQILINPTSGLPTSSDATYYPIGDRIPTFTLGLTNSFRYKRLSLSFLWDLRYGGDVINQTEFEAYTRGISLKTLDRETPRVITGVLADGLQNTDHPTPNTISITPYNTAAYYTTNVAPEIFVEHNIKALRLRDATLGFDLPAKTVAKIGFIKSLGFTFTVTDAILITNYSGLDPESNSLNASSGGIGGYGIDYGNVGKPISYNLGLKVKL